MGVLFSRPPAVHATPAAPVAPAPTPAPAPKPAPAPSTSTSSYKEGYEAGRTAAQKEAEKKQKEIEKKQKEAEKQTEELEKQAAIEAEEERQETLKKRGWRSTILTGPADYYRPVSVGGKTTLGV